MFKAARSCSETIFRSAIKISPSFSLIEVSLTLSIFIFGGQLSQNFFLYSSGALQEQLRQ